jgi:hypothetical protein
VGLSYVSYYHAKRVVEAAEREPDKFGDLVHRMDATGKVETAYAELRRREAGAPAAPKAPAKSKRHAALRKLHHPKPNREVERPPPRARRCVSATSFLQFRCPVFRVLIAAQRSEAAISTRRPSGACGRAAAIG